MTGGVAGTLGVPWAACPRCAVNKLHVTNGQSRAGSMIWDVILTKEMINKPTHNQPRATPHDRAKYRVTNVKRGKTAGLYQPPEVSAALSKKLTPGS